MVSMNKIKMEQMSLPSTYVMATKKAHRGSVILAIKKMIMKQIFRSRNTEEEQARTNARIQDTSR